MIKRRLGNPMVSWNTTFENLEFGKKILTQDTLDRFYIYTAIEGMTHEDGSVDIDLLDEAENLVDDCDITRWVYLDDVLPQQEA